MILSMLGTMGGSFVLSAVTSLMAQAREDKHEQRMSEIATMRNATTSHDAAARRGGQFVRRMIAFFCIIYFFIVPALLYYNDPSQYLTAYGHLKSAGGIKSLFIGSNTKLVVESFKGLPMIPEQLHTLSAIIGFYFGADATKR